MLYVSEPQISKVDKLWGKLNIGYLNENTEKSQFFKSVVVYIGSEIFYSTINYHGKEPNLELHIIIGSADIYVCHKQPTLVEIYVQNSLILIAVLKR